MDYQSSPYAVAQSSVEERAAFITRTYLHLLGAIIAFVGMEVVLFTTGAAELIGRTVLGSQFGWLAMLGGFMAVSYVADRWARSATSLGMQYAGLSLYVFAESIIFAPLLLMAALYAEPGTIPKAAGITLVLFGGLTGIVFVTRKDFSFMRGVIMLGFLVAMGLIVSSIVFGFELGIMFSWAMLGLAAAKILYDTSNIMLHYRTDQHVSAALSLFASVALMFWYVLRILMSRR